MAIRVTHQSMYNTMVDRMQKNLGNYMESVEQGSTQKKINRPSDDPAGTYRVLTTRVDQTSNSQYRENVDTAKGWLNLADDVLSSRVTNAITGLKTLAEQASTGTYSPEQRAIMAEQARQYFGQLLNLSNTDFEGKSIFAGHKYDGTAFEQGLAITTWDNELDNIKKLKEEAEKKYDDPVAKETAEKVYNDALGQTFSQLVKEGQAQVVGASEKSIMVQFLEDGPLDVGTKYRWSNDGGASWNTGEVSIENQGVENEQKYILNLGDDGAFIKLNIEKLDSDGKPIKDANGKTIQNTWNTVAASTEQTNGARNGTTLYLRPGAFYQGDDKDPPVDITQMKNSNIENVSANGSFGKNILVRVDGVWDEKAGEYKPVDMNKTDQAFTWHYSTDGGSTWIAAKGKTTGGDLRLPIPGGYLDIKNQTKPIAVGSQILVHPSRADLGYEIMKDTYLNVNGVGKDIFGGIYEGKPALDGDNNLFEVVGSFIGYLDFNNQEGCQRTLVALEKAEKQILHEATRVGGMENRVEMASEVLSAQKLDLDERLSYTEDIDLTELLTKLTRQQLTYQTVLQSSSMIMQMSLANYV